MDTYSKFDLHIHSFASSRTKSGDSAYVANSKIENIATLVDGLIRNQVNIVAITDHNIFDKELYLELKKQEEAYNCIHKVLPGIEIDLRIDDNNVHVICIFDDSDINHADKIQAGFVSKDYYSVDDLGGLLRNVELGTVLIAHQKCDYLSMSPQRTSLSCVGTETFYKFIGSEFFDALEIQNTKVEGILKSRFTDDGIEDINLITGSDCHEWIAYPEHHMGAIPANLLYMKALPTFRGLVMSITDYTRIYNNTEPPKENILKELKLLINEVPKTIQLSDKINVIIGDNAVGKSTLIKYLSDEVEVGAIEFLATHGVRIATEKLDRTKFSFSSQGNIRRMFESSQEKHPIKERFKNYFKPIGLQKYQEIIVNILRYYERIWNRNERINSNAQNIAQSLYIPCFSDTDKHYLSVESNISTLENKYIDLVSVFKDIFDKFKNLNEYVDIIEQDDIKELITIREQLKLIGKKYEKRQYEIETSNAIISTFLYASKSYNVEIARRSSSDESSLNSFKSECQKVIGSICLDIEHRFVDIKNVWDDFKDFKVENSVNSTGKYCFIYKPIRELTINREVIYEFISNYLAIKKPLEMITTSEILGSIKGKRISERIASNLNQFLDIINDDFNNYYFGTTVEIKRGNDRLNESNSAGINALYYIDILSDIYSRPIFIIDQPEDDVSQSRISTDLIHSLKCMAKRSQVIIVTHNPQLVVNLDADNVIVLKKNETEINFYSGPLEFKDSEYSILDMVASTLDGGADAIKKRWKRYDKTSGV